MFDSVNRIFFLTLPSSTNKCQGIRTEEKNDHKKTVNSKKNDYFFSLISDKTNIS